MGICHFSDMLDHKINPLIEKMTVRLFNITIIIVGFLVNQSNLMSSTVCQTNSEIKTEHVRHQRNCHSYCLLLLFVHFL